MKRRTIVIILVIAGLVMAACGTATPTEAPGVAMTEAPVEATFAPTETLVVPVSTQAGTGTATLDAKPSATVWPTKTDVPTRTFTPTNTSTPTPTASSTATSNPNQKIVDLSTLPVKVVQTGVGTRVPFPGEFASIMLCDGNVVLMEEGEFKKNGYFNDEVGICAVNLLDEGKQKLWILPEEVTSAKPTSDGEISFCMDCAANTYGGYVKWQYLPTEGLLWDIVQLVQSQSLTIGTEQREKGGVFLITADPE